MFLDCVSKYGFILTIGFLLESIFAGKLFEEIVKEKDIFDLSNTLKNFEENKTSFNIPDVRPLITGNQTVDEYNMKVYTDIYTAEELQVMWYQFNKSLVERTTKEKKS